jgi:hypothetical protein
VISYKQTALRTANRQSELPLDPADLADCPFGH